MLHQEKGSSDLRTESLIHNEGEFVIEALVNYQLELLNFQ